MEFKSINNLLIVCQNKIFVQVPFKNHTAHLAEGPGNSQPLYRQFQRLLGVTLTRPPIQAEIQHLNTSNFFHYCKSNLRYAEGSR